MKNVFYLPDLTGARYVRHYFFRHPQHGPCSCVLVTDCQAASRVQYAHVLYVYAGGDFLTGRPCLAVASEVNRVATAGSAGSHFLGLFPGEPMHVNLGASDEWADLVKFAARALEIVAGHFSLPGLPQEIDTPAMMAQRFRPPRTYAQGQPDRPPQAGGEPPKEEKKKKGLRFW